MVSFSSVLVATTALLAATSTSAWRVRMFSSPPPSTAIVDNQSNVMTTNRCFNIPSSADNRAIRYSFVSGRRPKEYPSCRLRIYNTANCMRVPFTDTWQDVDSHRFRPQVCLPCPPSGRKCDR